MFWIRVAELLAAFLLGGFCFTHPDTLAALWARVAARVKAKT